MVMEIVHIKLNETYHLLPSVLAIGFFDGLHCGHMRLIDQVLKVSEEKSLKKAFMTFDVHPKTVYLKEKTTYLMTMKQKEIILKELGFDYFLIIDFNEEVAKFSPEQFIQNYFINLNVKHVVCGFDFTFGYRAKGRADHLKQLSQHFYDVDIIDEYDMNDQKVSSSCIKEYLHQGEIEKANQMLGRNYSIIGQVIHGRHNGHKIGFPTANVDYGHYVTMKKGVYGVYAYYQNKRYLAMTNIGYNPTLGALNKMSLEVNIFDFNQDIYDQVIKIEFLFRVRDECKFENVDALIKQLKKDKESIICRCD